MKKRVVVLFLAVMLVVGLFTGCGGAANTDGSSAANSVSTAKSDQSQSQDTKSQETKAANAKKAGLILGTGGLGDQSFNDLAYAGAKNAKEKLGIDFDYVEPKAVSDYEINQRDMASSGNYSVIVCVGFDQAEPLKKVAAEFPNQKFALIDEVVDAPNVASYTSKEEEGSFLVGAMAGFMKEKNGDYKLNDKNVIGFVGALDIPLIRKFEAGYTAGAKYVNPKINVLDGFVGGFSDTTTAKEMATAMFQKGADIIYHAAGGSGMGVFQSAKEKNFFAIGVNSNQNFIDPEHIIASMLKRVDTAVFTVEKQASGGDFKAGKFALGIKDDGVGYTTEKSNVKVSDDIIKKVEAIKQKILSGELVPPAEMKDVDAFLQKNKNQ